jgi:hypothetical protein
VALLEHVTILKVVPEPKSKWVDKNKIDLREIGLCGMDYIIWLRIGTSGGLL